ncbi:hypothetical protein, partial [Curtobacterium sp. PsM8]|uniref:hypothetical protein n=1 Tax=Curtobacterium sp. PsM8 TaxID=3030532 RepID=UPI00263B57C8
AYQIAEAMDAQASPAWTVWRWQVPTIEIIESAELAKTTQAQTPTTAQTFVNQGIVSAQKLLVLSLLLNQD